MRRTTLAEAYSCKHCAQQVERAAFANIDYPKNLSRERTDC